MAKINDMTAITFRKTVIDLPDEDTPVEDTIHTSLRPTVEGPYLPDVEYKVLYTTPLETPVQVFLIGGSTRTLYSGNGVLTEEIVTIIQGTGGELQHVPFGDPKSMEWLGEVISECEPMHPQPPILFDASTNSVVANTSSVITGTVKIVYIARTTAIMVIFDPKPPILPDGYDGTALLVVRQVIPGQGEKYKQTTYEFAVGDPEEES